MLTVHSHMKVGNRSRPHSISLRLEEITVVPLYRRGWVSSPQQTPKTVDSTTDLHVYCMLPAHIYASLTSKLGKEMDNYSKTWQSQYSIVNIKLVKCLFLKFPM